MAHACCTFNKCGIQMFQGRDGGRDGQEDEMDVGDINSNTDSKSVKIENNIVVLPYIGILFDINT